LLYCGVDGTLASTVRDLFSYVGLAGMVSVLPSSIADFTVTLDGKIVSEKHNVLWFNSSFHIQTTVNSASISSTS
jgi:hypothetical protein